MLYLLAAVICSALIALLFKHSETSGSNRYAVTAANYAAASALAAVLIAATWRNMPHALSITGSSRAIARVFLTGAPLPPSNSLVWSLAVGLGAGVLFFLAFVYYQAAIKAYPVGLAGAFSKLGVIVPVVLSVLFWRELPGSLQWLGVALALAAIALIAWPGGRAHGPSVRPALLLLFLFGGLAEFSTKFFQQYGYQDDKLIFLLATFGTALLLSTAVALRRRQAVTQRDLLLGAAVGVPNLFSSFFLIRALDTVPAAVAFPLYGAGTIVVIATLGALLFRERLSRRELIGVAAAIAAVSLINLT